MLKTHHEDSRHVLIASWERDVAVVALSGDDLRDKEKAALGSASAPRRPSTTILTISIESAMRSRLGRL